MSSEIQVDEETRAALLLFNDRLAETAAEERATKRIAKAERAKDTAAARVRTVNEDLGSSADAKAEAEAAYKAAVAEVARVTEDPHDRPRSKPTETTTEDTPTETTTDVAPSEVSADEETSPPEADAESE